jgi:poly(hydroxyalkanoate) depolymerase family esterase
LLSRITPCFAHAPIPVSDAPETDRHKRFAHHAKELQMNSKNRFSKQMRQVARLPLRLIDACAKPVRRAALAGAPPWHAGLSLDIFPISGRGRFTQPRGRQDSGSRSRRRTPQSWPYAKSEGPSVRSGAVEARDGNQHNPHAPGRFLDASIANDAGHRTYKLYIPGCYRGQALPLVVMLHGCKQDPDDFAEGTRMNLVAEERQCFVLYPAQSKAANHPKCWSWFNAADQERDGGEPSLIADMVRQVIRDYRIDESRVYVAGLSAGGAMAVIMATTYPDLFAAAAIHSGLPYNAANGLFSAISTMKIGPRRTRGASEPSTDAAIPMIVFYGDADKVVHPRNGEQVVRQAVSAQGAASNDEDGASAATGVIEYGASSGRRFTRTVYRDEGGRSVAEQWVIHGAGHAWSGGSGKGSFTDPEGPDASAEMMRFFYERKRAEDDADAPPALRAAF